MNNSKIVKLFEVRDRATLIPIMCINISDQFDPKEDALLERSGYGSRYDRFYIYCIDLENQKSHLSPWDWDPGIRTMMEAHKYVLDNWSDLESGDVIDIEYILGEVDHPKTSEVRVNQW